MVVELPRGKPVVGLFPAVVGWHGLCLRNIDDGRVLRGLVPMFSISMPEWISASVVRGRRKGVAGCFRWLEGGGEGGAGGDARAVLYWHFLWRLLLWYRGVNRVPGLWFLPEEVLEPRYEG